MAMQIGGEDGEDEIMSQINTTPLVDVMLVLLIIFLITIPVVTTSIKVNLPKASDTASLAKPQTKGITITADGQIYLDAYPVSIEQLQTNLAQYKAANPNLPVVLKADEVAQYDKVMEVLEVAKKLDITEIGLVTKRAQ